MIRPGGAAAAAARAGAATVAVGAGGATAAAGRSASFGVPLGPDAPTSNTISGEPTATFSPGAPVTETTLPLTGAGTSTAALSVITSTMIWSSATVAPGAVCQAMISASTVPSPRSGILKMN
jgi:hypothetical protein